MPFTIAAPTMVPGLRWLCTLMHTSESRSVFRAGLPWAPTTQIGLFWAGALYFQRKNFSSENTTRVKSKTFTCRLPPTETTPTRCCTSRQKFNLAKRFSAVNRDARTGFKHRAGRSSRCARHSVERDMFNELCLRSTLGVCRGVSVAAVSISADTSVFRRRLSGRDWSGAPRRSCLIFVLMLSSDKSGRIAHTSRGFRPSTSHWRS